MNVSIIKFVFKFPTSSGHGHGLKEYWYGQIIGMDNRVVNHVITKLENTTINMWLGTNDRDI